MVLNICRAFSQLSSMSWRMPVRKSPRWPLTSSLCGLSASRIALTGTRGDEGIILCLVGVAIQHVEAPRDFARVEKTRIEQFLVAQHRHVVEVEIAHLTEGEGLRASPEAAQERQRECGSRSRRKRP